jgi:hypothetical protein
MTPTVGTLSEITPDGSREQGSETVGKILVTKQVPKIVKVACRFAKARQRKTVVYMLGVGDPTANRPDIPMTKRTAEQLVNSLGDHRFDDLDLIVQSSGGDIHAAYLIMHDEVESRGEVKSGTVERVQDRGTGRAGLDGAGQTAVADPSPACAGRRPDPASSAMQASVRPAGARPFLNNSGGHHHPSAEARGGVSAFS